MGDSPRFSVETPSTPQPERCNRNWGAHAPARVPTGALAGWGLASGSHGTVAGPEVSRWLARAPATAREGACATLSTASFRLRGRTLLHSSHRGCHPRLFRLSRFAASNTGAASRWCISLCITSSCGHVSNGVLVYGLPSRFRSCGRRCQPESGREAAAGLRQAFGWDRRPSRAGSLLDARSQGT